MVVGLRVSPSMVVMVNSIVEVGVALVDGSPISSIAGETQMTVRARLLLLVGVRVRGAGVAGTNRSPNRHCRGLSVRVEMLGGRGKGGISVERVNRYY